MIYVFADSFVDLLWFMEAFGCHVGWSSTSSGIRFGFLRLRQAAEEGVVEELTGVGGTGVWVVGAVVSLAVVQVAASSVDVGCDCLIVYLIQPIVVIDWDLSSLEHLWRPCLLVCL